MPRANISDWLSSLNQEISSYAAEQNMYYSIFWVILALFLTIAGINMTITNLLVSQVNWIFAFAILVIDIILVSVWYSQKFSPKRQYQKALQIRMKILKGTLEKSDDIYNECVNAELL